MKIWTLKRGSDARFRRGHPWIFASELAHSAKEIRAGEVVELRDSEGKFLAYGYGHPSSQICFRKLSSRKKENDVLSVRFFAERLRTSRSLRETAGVTGFSHRWLFAEADGVPGLIVDAFKSGERWIAVVQASTAGIEAALENLYAALREFGDLTIVEAPSSKSRKLEGLALGEKRVVAGVSEGLESCTVELRHGLKMTADLLRGQKTGFFLDQQTNASLLREMIAHRFHSGAGEGCGRDSDASRADGQPVRILDVCCYVGQWGSHAAHALKQIGRASEVTLLDVSSSALALAKKNVAQFTDQVICVEGDAMEAAAQLAEGHYDVVICDPPAFVKKKADLPQGLKAYAKLNRMTIRAVTPGGLYVASSCSGLVKGEDWQEVLVQSAVGAGRTFKQLAKTGHAADHPVRAEFPEGEYLKCVIGTIDYPF